MQLKQHSKASSNLGGSSCTTGSPRVSLTYLLTHQAGCWVPVSRSSNWLQTGITDYLPSTLFELPRTRCRSSLGCLLPLSSPEKTNKCCSAPLISELDSRKVGYYKQWECIYWNLKYIQVFYKKTQIYKLIG